METNSVMLAGRRRSNTPSRSSDSRDNAASSGPAGNAFAGMWEKWILPTGEQLPTFATITTDANQTVEAIQDRMPVILGQEGLGYLAGRDG
jgi:SOS response associated peptidase (SRAP)